MKELATYAKQHVPKEHPKVKNKKNDLQICEFDWFFFKKDAAEFFEERRRKLVEAGIIPVLVQLCKHKSENCREQVSRLEDKENFLSNKKFELSLQNFSWTL